MSDEEFENVNINAWRHGFKWSINECLRLEREYDFINNIKKKFSSLGRPFKSTKQTLNNNVNSEVYKQINNKVINTDTAKIIKNFTKSDEKFNSLVEDFKYNLKTNSSREKNKNKYNNFSKFIKKNYNYIRKNFQTSNRTFNDLEKEYEFFSKRIHHNHSDFI